MPGYRAEDESKADRHMAATLRVPDAQSCNRAHLPIPGYAIHDTRQHRWKSRRFQSEETPAASVSAAGATLLTLPRKMTPFAASIVTSVNSPCLIFAISTPLILILTSIVARSES